MYHFRYVMQYLAWRVLVGLHQSISVSFLIVGHTKFAPDWCFGLFKQRFRKCKVDCLDNYSQGGRRECWSERTCLLKVAKCSCPHMTGPHSLTNPSIKQLWRESNLSTIFSSLPNTPGRFSSNLPLTNLGRRSRCSLTWTGRSSLVNYHQ